MTKRVQSTNLTHDQREAVSPFSHRLVDMEIDAGSEKLGSRLCKPLNIQTQSKMNAKTRPHSTSVRVDSSISLTEENVGCERGRLLRPCENDRCEQAQSKMDGPCLQPIHDATVENIMLDTEVTNRSDPVSTGMVQHPPLSLDSAKVSREIGRGSASVRVQDFSVSAEIAQVGIDVEWRPGPKPCRPLDKNHGPCLRYLRAVTRSIREGQDLGQYMVVDIDILDRWPEIVCSPLGAVEKKGVDPSDEVRVIHDLSFPKNTSVNAAFVAESVPKVQYASVVGIAQHIEYLATHGYAGCIRILKGDVKSAFRHLRTRANQVFRMAACVKELGVVIIDMAAPFGWAGSPPCYALFARAISWHMGTISPRIFEADIEDRLLLAEATLRHAMLAVLGPRYINEAKFSEWCTEIVALGLLWDTVRRTVSMPSDKIAKASRRVEALLKLGTASKTELNKALGSLRHVTICLRTAKPFYQRLQGQCTQAPRFGRIRLSRGATADLLWFQQILHHGYLADLPLAMFGTLPSPNVVLLMDASDNGLAALNPATNEFVQLKFDQDETKMVKKLEPRDQSSLLTFTEWLPENPRKHSYQLALFAVYSWRYGWNNSETGNSANTVLAKKSLISRGIIAECLSTESVCSQDTTLPSLECDGRNLPAAPNTQSRLISLSDARFSRLHTNPAPSHLGASLLGFFFLLRRSEYLADGATVKPNALQREDVKFVGFDDREIKDLENVVAVIIRFRGSKSDQFGEGALRRLERSGQNWCCPVLAAWFRVQHHKSLRELQPTRKTDVSTNRQVRDVVKAVKFAAKQAGQSPKSYGSHLLHSSGATALFNAGFDGLAVKLFERWKSDAMERGACVTNATYTYLENKHAQTHRKTASYYTANFAKPFNTYVADLLNDDLCAHFRWRCRFDGQLVRCRGVASCSEM
ncbi:unnamed protein product [Phytophthora lilii]|uniref:Unnamed protein product n=1 Tax=Phytophthora lilii TaxID=2077276 RepID=A0A9W6WZ63_9STRA|nr:unnamed protein product [Phytophthora lilii]